MLGEWTPVEEQSMPDMFMNVLVCQDTGAVFIAQFEGPDGWYSANNLAIQEPEGWMHLPEPMHKVKSC